MMSRNYKDASSKRGYGAMAARLTPDQKVGRSNRSGLIFGLPSRLPKKTIKQHNTGMRMQKTTQRTLWKARQKHIAGKCQNLVRDTANKNV